LQSEQSQESTVNAYHRRNTSRIGQIGTTSLTVDKLSGFPSKLNTPSLPVGDKMAENAVECSCASERYPDIAIACAESNETDITFVSMYLNLGNFRKYSAGGTRYRVNYENWLSAFRYLAQPLLFFSDHEPFRKKIEFLRSGRELQDAKIRAADAENSPPDLRNL